MKRQILDQQQLLTWQKTGQASTTFLQQLSETFQEALLCLQRGELVIYPTETVYGLGVDAENQAAVDRLLQYKGRREGKPMSIAVANPEMAEKYVVVNDQAKKFYERFLPGPYTVVSQGKKVVAPGVESEFGSLGIRIPAYRFITTLVEKFGRAITSTSANASDQKRPYTVEDILLPLSERQKNLIGFIIDVGTLPKNEPSTVIDTTLSTPLVMRGQQLDNAAAKNTLLFSSRNEQETKDLAGRLILKHWNQLGSTGLLFALNGELGMGKTIFAQGVGQFLGIPSAIQSPTYSYINEYSFSKNSHSGVFYHIDAWKIDSAAEVEFLQLAQLYHANSVIVIEWWQQIAPFLTDEFKQHAIVLDFHTPDLANMLALNKESAIQATSARQISIYDPIQ